MALTRFRIDEEPHAMDGLRLLAQEGTREVEAFVSRKVMDVWAESVEHSGGRQSLCRKQYNALGKRNFAALQRIVPAPPRPEGMLPPPSSPDAPITRCVRSGAGAVAHFGAISKI